MAQHEWTHVVILTAKRSHRREELNLEVLEDLDMTGLTEEDRGLLTVTYTEYLLKGPDDD